jgi:hypothetical protein
MTSMAARLHIGLSLAGISGAETGVNGGARGW